MEARRYCLRFNQPFREKTTGLETGKFDFQIYTDWNRIRITRILNNHCCTESKQPDALACRMPKTISGGGTEWISRDDIDELVMENRWLDTAPLKTGKEIRQKKFRHVLAERQLLARRI